MNGQHRALCPNRFTASYFAVVTHKIADAFVPELLLELELQLPDYPWHTYLYNILVCTIQNLQHD